MNKQNIKIFKDINDPQLKVGWIKLQGEVEAFPQMYYEWIAAWWKFKHASRELHIIAVLDNKDEIIGIAPFCIEREFAINILRSIPIHFGDFYEALAINDDVVKQIVEYTKTFDKWDIIHAFNVNDQSVSYLNFEKLDFKKREIVNILSPKFDCFDMDDFLSTISSNSRQRYRKIVRKIEKEGELKVIPVRTWDGYKENFELTKQLYNKRWEGDSRPLLSDDYYEIRNNALEPLFKKEKAILYLISLDEKVIAFRLGFLNKNTFYDWKVSHDTDFNKFSPGFISVGLIIENLIAMGAKELNFMTGDYQYKRSWANNDENSVNYEVLYAKKFSLGWIYMMYRLEYREKIKSLFHDVKNRLKR